MSNKSVLPAFAMEKARTVDAPEAGGGTERLCRIGVGRNCISRLEDFNARLHAPAVVSAQPPSGQSQSSRASILQEPAKRIAEAAEEVEMRPPTRREQS